MKRDFIFVFILLATLSMVNAIPHQLHKRDTTFNQCLKSDASLLTVSVSPDPPVPGQTATYTISERQSLPSTGELKFIGEPIVTELCAKAACPTDSISIVEQVTIPAALPKVYSNAIGILDPAKIEYGCAIAAVGS